MKTKNYLNRIIIAAIAGLVSLQILADTGRTDGRHGHMGFLKHLDANKDGQLTQEEIDTEQKHRYTAFDVDNDGGMTLQEFEGLWMQLMRERMVDQFQHFDQDGSGAITMEEFHQPVVDAVARRDRNGDGILTQAELHHGNRNKHRQQSSAQQ